jgi:hypothetical protein
MKRIIVIALLFTLNKAFSQNKRDTTIIWYSVPCHDSLGNVTVYKKTFHHIPTRHDTIEFGHIIDSERGKTKKINSRKPKK